MSENIPSPQEIEAQQRRIIITACCIEGVAFAVVGAVTGETVGSAIETQYAQEETSAASVSSSQPEAALNLVGAGVGVTLGLAAAFAMCCHYLRQNRARTDG